MEIVVFKWISAIVILVTTFIGNALPMRITAAKWTSRLESLAGGVFLGAGLAHLLADSFEELDEVSEYPIGPATALLTFCLLTFVELFSYGEHDEEFNTENQQQSYTSLESKDSIAEQPSRPMILFSTDKSKLTVPIISLYIIMDIHSTIEGIALGILPKWANVIAIFCAIVGHKPVEAFALSLVILKGKPTKVVFWLMVCLYCILSPVGILIAIYLGKISSKLTLGIIAAFSAGTFLFVGCHEWSEMFEHKKEWPTSEKVWHFSMFAGGVIWMLLIAIIEAIYPED